MSAADVQTPAALPSELNYALPASLPAGWRCQQLRQPTISNLPTSVQSGYEFQIQIPQLPNSFLDLSSAYFNIRATFGYTAGTTAVTTTATAPRILGSAWSMFQRYEVYFNNANLLDQIQYPGIAVNAMNNLILSSAAKSAMNYQGLSSINTTPSFGTILHEDDGMIGTKAAASTAVANNRLDFALPMIGALGNCEKLLPLFLGGFRIDLTAEDINNFLVAGSAAVSAPNFTITSLEFVCNVITIDPGSLAAVLSAHPDKMFLRTQTYTQSSQTLPAQAGAGLYELMVSSRVSSMKSLLVCCSPANAYEKAFSGVCPNASSGTCVLVNNVMYPQNGMDPCGRPSDVQASNRIALSSLYSTLHTGLITRPQFCKSSTGQGLTVAYDSNAVANAHYMLIDTEVFGRKHGALLSGIDTKSGSTFMRYVIGATLANSVHTVNFYAVNDVILEVDLQSRQITRRV